jgi:hypothetical protein
MVDSGAYSAFTKGQSIALADYIAFLKANSQWIRTYVSLDAWVLAEEIGYQFRGFRMGGLEGCNGRR